MDSMKKQHDKIVASVAVAAVASAAPTVAMAEGIDGFSLLIPKPAEFIPALIAFLIIWVILAKLAWPTILKMMEDRENKIKNDLDEAEAARKDATASAEEYKARIAEADRKAGEIIAEAKREAEAQRAEILHKAQEDAAQIIAKAHGAVDSERHKAMVELSGSVVDLSVEIAGKVIGDALDENEQRELAEKYLSEVGSLNGE